MTPKRLSISKGIRERGKGEEEKKELSPVCYHLLNTRCPCVHIRTVRTYVRYLLVYLPTLLSTTVSVSIRFLPPNPLSVRERNTSDLRIDGLTEINTTKLTWHLLPLSSISTAFFSFPMTMKGTEPFFCLPPRLLLLYGMKEGRGMKELCSALLSVCAQRSCCAR